MEMTPPLAAGSSWSTGCYKHVDKYNIVIITKRARRKSLTSKLPSIRRVGIREEHRREKRIIYLSLMMFEQCFEDTIEVLLERHTDRGRMQGRKKKPVGRKVRKHGEP